MKIQFDAAKSGMYQQIHADIIDTISKKNNIRKWDNTKVRFHTDDSIELWIKLNLDDQTQPFDIARDV